MFENSIGYLGGEQTTVKIEYFTKNLSSPTVANQSF